MDTRHFTLALLAAGIATALAATPALAQTSGTITTSTTTVSTTTTSRDATRLETEFDTFAGSKTNSQALVDGLRNGTPITLTETVPGTNGGPSTTTTTTFTPDTGKMGYGNVKIALSLAEASLAKADITNPTAAEVAAALNGGKLVMADGSTVDLKGVLASRASGEGWGKIAKDMGFKLGDVERSPKHAGELAEHGHHDHDKVARVELAHGHGHDTDNRPARPEHLSKVDRPERPDRPSHPDHPDHPDHVGRPGG